jgi:predicted transcriptional regulator
MPWPSAIAAYRNTRDLPKPIRRHVSWRRTPAFDVLQSGSITLTVRLSTGTKDRLVILADRTRSFLAAEAIADYVARELAIVEAIETGRVEVRAGLPTGRPGRVIGTYEKLLPSLPYILAFEITARPEAGEQIAILHLIHGARHRPAECWPEDQPPP